MLFRKTNTSGRTIEANRKQRHFEQLEDRRMLAFSAPAVLIADDVGHLETATNPLYGGYKAVMTQSTGKIVVAGTAHGPKDDDFYLARYMADGSGDFVLDPTFGDDGVVLTNFLTSKRKKDVHPDVTHGAALDSQDRIVAVGELPFAGDDVIVRYTADGQLDTSFSDDGWDSPGDIFQTLASDITWSIAFDSNDAPVVAATGAWQDDVRIFRYDATGNFDNSFGIVTPSVPGREWHGGFDKNIELSIYPATAPSHSGKIVLAGSTTGEFFDPDVGANLTRNDWTVLRLNTDGTLDTSFDDDGYAIQRVYDPSPNPFVWNDGGTAENSYARGIVIEPDGRIAVAGYTAEGMTITRYNADGSYDTSLNPTGIQPGRVGVWIEELGHVDHSDLIGFEVATEIIVDGDGNYLLGGQWQYGGGDNDGDGYLDDTSGTLDRFAFARFLPNGTVDTSFGDEGDGSYLEYVGAGRNRLSGLTLSGSGEIWAAGYDGDRKSILFRFAEPSDNQTPVAIDDAFATDEDSPLDVPAAGVLTNDLDPDGDTLTVVDYDSTSVLGAAVSIGSDGSVSYDPRNAVALQNLAEGETVDDTFTYTVSDGRGGVATATVMVTVTGLAEPPTSDITIFISDIFFESKRRGRDHRAAVEIRDVDGNAVAGITLKVDFAGTTYELTTDSSGIARTNWVRNLSGNHYADAYDLALGDPDYSWTPFALDLEDDSDNDGKADDLLVLS